MLSWTEYQKRIETESFIVIQLDRMGCQVIRKNREYIEALIEVVLYCAQQGIALRGHDESNDLSNPGNFKCPVKLLSRHSSVIKYRLQESSKSATWLSPAFQNENIHFLAEQVRGYIT